MSDITVTVQAITDIVPHPNADKLEIAKILGTQTIIGKGQFQRGDLVVYFPPDICLPADVSAQLGVDKYLKTALFRGEKFPCKVAACRLRGVPSYGFVAALPDLPGLHPDRDLTEHYKAAKYEPPPRAIHRGGTGEVWGGLAQEPINFHHYTDIQNHWKYHKAIEEGTPVRVTEKIHGCVRSSTRLTMADGTKKKISQIKVGEYVAGFWNGQVVPAKVLHTFNNGPSDKWLRVVVDRRGAGQGGNNVGAIHCTPNHRFWCNNEYVAADCLQVGDTVTLLRSDVGLTPVQHAVLLGKMIGDGSLCVLESGAALISVGHKDTALLDWTARGLGGLFTATTDATSGFGSTIHRAHTVASHAIAEAFGDFHTDKRDYGAKRIPFWVADALTPLAIAFWYMDDGSLGHGNDGSEDKALFAVCRYNEADCEVLIRGLARFGIDARYYTASGYSRLRLNADDAERLFLLIAPYIPPAMQYKLPARYRGHEGWLPPTTKTYKSLLVPQQVVAIEEYDAPRTNRYDIETETHNYFANGILTHNSNSRVALLKVDGEWDFYCGSHKKCRRQFQPDGEESVYWSPLHLPGVMELLTHLCDEQNDVIIFGELYGPGVQDMDYGVPVGDIGWRVYDISVNGCYLGWVEVSNLCVLHRIETVPLLYTGSFDPARLDEWTNGPTTVAAAGDIKTKFKGREGCVITPLIETYSDYLGGRLILKSVSADYEDRKGARDEGEL